MCTLPMAGSCAPMTLTPCALGFCLESCLTMPCPCLQDFPIGEEKLIELAKKLNEAGTGLKDDSLLAPDFR